MLAYIDDKMYMNRRSETAYRYMIYIHYKSRDFIDYYKRVQKYTQRGFTILGYNNKSEPSQFTKKSGMYYSSDITQTKNIDDLLEFYKKARPSINWIIE